MLEIRSIALLLFNNLPSQIRLVFGHDVKYLDKASKSIYILRICIYITLEIPWCDGEQLTVNAKVGHQIKDDCPKP